MVDFVQEEYLQMSVALEKGVEAGWLRPVIDREFPLNEAAEAHREVIHHKQGSAGKLIISVWIVSVTVTSEQYPGSGLD